ncbi:LysR family transcriptional regulator [Phreatobacter stygius]|uniref:LysR family transcriptional regulator n=1 Tax=Phreatobacter stygius TaxID=1940610 RepID=A0A4D7BAB8_9HYPH|nr:LysR family transcriptional regulator [Phreatobacter stygius]QCI65017.1 LysR family transcriptional regulator [Phreatobacter stygius]
MTLEQLRIFVAVAEREHLTRAASALNLTPSAVSSAVRALEDRHGISLFHRVGRRIELTEAGAIFLGEARATLARARAAELALAELGGLKRGAIHIEASQTIGSYWLPRLLARFHDAHPAIALQLTSGNTRSVAEAVLNGRAELGFIEGVIDQPALSSKVVAEDRLILVAAPRHAWTDGRPIRPGDLAAARWVMREAGSGTRSVLEAALGAHGLAPAELNVALELPSNEALCSAVEAGTLVAAVSELVAAARLAAGRLKRIDFALPPRAFSLVRHKERYRTKASLALETMIGERDA